MAAARCEHEARMLLPAAAEATDSEPLSPLPVRASTRPSDGKRLSKCAAVALAVGLLACLAVGGALSRLGAAPQVRVAATQRAVRTTALSEDVWEGDGWDDDGWEDGGDDDWVDDDDGEWEDDDQKEPAPVADSAKERLMESPPGRSGGKDSSKGEDDLEDGLEDADFEDDLEDDDAGEEDSVGPAQDPTHAHCSDSGHDCTKTKCCSQPGEQCYMQGHLASGPWAVCRSDCMRGRHVTDVGGRPWTCEKVGDRTPGKAPKCSAYGKNCIQSHCCRDVGLQCYQKNDGYATCKPSCSKVMDPLDKDSDPWTCKELGTRRLGRAPWTAEECSDDGSDCRQTKCCKRTGSTCFELDDQWATCQDVCDDKSSSCKRLGPPMPMREADALELLAPKIKAAPWVKSKCATFGSNCMDEKCCADAGAMCYEKNSQYASCKRACVKGVDPADGEGRGNWSCDEIGPRTPGTLEVHVMQGGSKADWVEEGCSDTGADCSSTRCCKEEGFQCLKDSDKTTCRAGCHGCEALGAPTPKEWNDAVTLFCWVVVTRDTYEVDVMREQLRKRAGIFACEEQAMMTHDVGWTLDDEMGGEMMPFETAEVGVSKDGTAGNALLFINAWEAVIGLEKWKSHDWTIKTDPDALVVPDRLRTSLSKLKDDAHLGDGLFAYVKTCHTDNGMQDMMFGAMEALTKVAVKKYSEGVSKCRGLDWKAWGEDLFMMNCMDSLGATGMDSFGIVSDGLCNGLDCGNPNAGVFHPMKTVDSWNACFDQVVR